MITYIRRLFFATLALTTLTTFVVQPTAEAITESALKSILQWTPFYGDDDAARQGCSTSTATGDTVLTGSDNVQITFNYFVGKGLSEYVAAAIVGNFMQESGLNPKINQIGGGPGRGIAQWSVDGRWVNLGQAFPGEKMFELGSQLEFVWMELNAKAPAGDYTNVLKNMQQFTTDNEVDLLKITGTFMGTTLASELDSATIDFRAKFGDIRGYEEPGTPHLDKRILYAEQTLKKYGSSGLGTTTVAVSGTNASCGSPGSIDCANFTTTTSTLSQTRQNVVCLARAELAKWESGAMGPGTDFYTYSQGRDEEWCADFTSWIFNKAGYPLTSSNEGNVAAVQGIRDIGEAGGRFKYHNKAGYTPVPGDIVVYQNGWSHVNIVTSVNVNESKVVTIGGNQNGTSTANTSSRVSEQTYDFSDSHITGYVSPEN